MRGGKPLAAALALAGVWAWSPVARADALMPPPVQCPAGSRADASHRGVVCEPTTCKTDADCARFEGRGSQGTWSCQEAPLCIEHMEGDRTWHGPRTQDVARRPCLTQDHCVRPETCQTATRCVYAPSAASAPSGGDAEGDAKPARGCGCSTASTSQDARWAALLPGLAVAMAWARRARRAPR